MKTRGSVSMHILLKIVRLCEDTRIGCGRCDAKENNRWMSWMAFKKRSFNFRANAASWSFGGIYALILQTFKRHRNSSCRNIGLYPVGTGKPYWIWQQKLSLLNVCNHCLKLVSALDANVYCTRVTLFHSEMCYIDIILSKLRFTSIDNLYRNWVTCTSGFWPPYWTSDFR